MDVDYFGGCPTCGKNDGYVNAGSTHVFYCTEHRVSWIFGANLFSGWRDETEEEQREKYKLIEDFERVEPLWPDNAHVVFSSRAMTSEEPPRTVKQMADDLKNIAAEVALAGERYDHSALPRCAVRSAAHRRYVHT